MRKNLKEDVGGTDPRTVVAQNGILEPDVQKITKRIHGVEDLFNAYVDGLCHIDAPNTIVRIAGIFDLNGNYDQHIEDQPIGVAFVVLSSVLLVSRWIYLYGKQTEQTQRWLNAALYVWAIKVYQAEQESTSDQENTASILISEESSVASSTPSSVDRTAAELVIKNAKRNFQTEINEAAKLALGEGTYTLSFKSDGTEDAGIDFDIVAMANPQVGGVQVEDEESGTLSRWLFRLQKTKFYKAANTLTMVLFSTTMCFWAIQWAFFYVLPMVSEFINVAIPVTPQLFTGLAVFVPLAIPLFYLSYLLYRHFKPAKSDYSLKKQVLQALADKLAAEKMERAAVRVRKELKLQIGSLSLDEQGTLLVKGIFAQAEEIAEWELQGLKLQAKTSSDEITSIKALTDEQSWRRKFIIPLITGISWHNAAIFHVWYISTAITFFISLAGVVLETALLSTPAGIIAMVGVCLVAGAWTFFKKRQEQIRDINKYQSKLDELKAEHASSLIYLEKIESTLKEKRTIIEIAEAQLTAELEENRQLRKQLSAGELAGLNVKDTTVYERLYYGIANSEANSDSVFNNASHDKINSTNPYSPWTMIKKGYNRFIALVDGFGGGVLIVRNYLLPGSIVALILATSGLPPLTLGLICAAAVVVGLTYATLKTWNYYKQKQEEKQKRLLNEVTTRVVAAEQEYQTLALHEVNAEQRLRVIQAENERLNTYINQRPVQAKSRWAFVSTRARGIFANIRHQQRPKDVSNKNNDPLSPDDKEIVDSAASKRFRN